MGGGAAVGAGGKSTAADAAGGEGATSGEGTAIVDAEAGRASRGSNAATPAGVIARDPGLLAMLREQRGKAATNSSPGRKGACSSPATNRSQCQQRSQRPSPSRPRPARACDAGRRRSTVAWSAMPSSCRGLVRRVRFNVMSQESGAAKRFSRGLFSRNARILNYIDNWPICTLNIDVRFKGNMRDLCSS